jgi:ribosome-binding factor A|tara:strand:+ start:838 stop:1188 length:351 start_codon:yes stop_codon:yes gene_type:complete
MNKRVQRVNSLIQEKLSYSIMNDLNDPRTQGLLTITSVETSPDLKAANVYISIIGSNLPESEVLEGLNSASPFLKRSLENSAMKNIPRLTFLLDNSIENAERLSRIIKNNTPEIPN